MAKRPQWPPQMMENQCTAKRELTQEWPSGQSLRGQYKVGITWWLPDWWQTKIAFPHTQIAHLVWISTNSTSYMHVNVCLEKLCGPEGVGLWVHSICCRECAKPGVEEGVCCGSHARVLRL
uniref:Uncharacterized protein n=1 Tax=Arundo donax TaxID=35708 RepID=A0A0A9FQ22_ARUDO